MSTNDPPASFFSRWERVIKETPMSNDRPTETADDPVERARKLLREAERVAELDRTLNSEDDTPVRITPDGRVVPMTNASPTETAEHLRLDRGDVILLWGIMDAFLRGKTGDWVRARRILAQLSEMMDRAVENG